jgi:hypothetical protein
MRFLVKHAGVARPHFAGIEDLRESESEQDGECDVAIGRVVARFSDGGDSLDVESERRSMGVDDR